MFDIIKQLTVVWQHICDTILRCQVQLTQNRLFNTRALIFNCIWAILLVLIFTIYNKWLVIYELRGRISKCCLIKKKVDYIFLKFLQSYLLLKTYFCMLYETRQLQIWVYIEQIIR